MKKTVLFLAALLIVCSFLCSCGENNEIVFEKVENIESEIVTETSTEIKEELVFTAEIASDAFLASTKDYHSFKAEGENYIPILFKTSEAVFNLELYKIRLDTNGKYVKADVLYTLDELTPDKHLVGSILIVGTTPQMALCFTDGAGVTYNYSINKRSGDKIVLSKIELTETSN